MSSPLLKGNRIVNPMSKTILSLQVNDQLQTNLESSVNPRETVKILLNIVTDLLFAHAEVLVENKDKPKVGL